MVRDPAVTRHKLLNAAYAEFAEHGLAGSRIDRIAETAGVNKRMIYAYFGGKEQLFERVVEESLEALATDVPMNAADLPEYAGLLFDYLVAHPERRRLALWRVLEGSAPTEMESAATAAKVATLDKSLGRNAGFDGKTMLVFLMALVQAWPNAAPALANDKERQRQRATVVEAVRRLSHH
jgi:AcrR family transcriptional regulator